VLGLLLFCLGLEVICGWLLQVRAMVEIRVGLVAMVFNTALCFTLSGLALLLPGLLRRPLVRLQSVIGVILIGLPALILLEHVFDASFGIDWAFLHKWLNDGNTRPGRLAPNTAIGFMLAGACLLLLNRITSRRREILFQVGTFCLLAIGLTGLIGYLLSPDQLFGWARSARMALHTASAMVLLALALWCSWEHDRGEHAPGFLGLDEKIGFMSAAVMCVVALVAGLTGFVFQQSILEASQRDKLQFRLNGQLGTIQLALAQAQRQADRVVSDERWHDAVHLRVHDWRGQRAAARSWPVFDALLQHGFVSAQLALPDGTLVYQAGQAAQSAATELNLPGSADRKVALIWDGALSLRSTLPLLQNGQLVAHLTLVQAMPMVQTQLLDLRGLGSTGEIMLCGAQAGQPGALQCLPSGRHRHPFTVVHGNPSDPTVPMSLAISGHAGLMTALDYQGQNVLAAFAPVAPNLGLVVKQQSAELYGMIRNQLELLIPALVLLLLLGSIVMRSQIRPLVQRLRALESRAHEQRLEINTVLESVGEGILTMDEAGIIQSCNLAAAIFGYAADEVIGQSLTMLMPEEMRDAHRIGMQRYLESGNARVVGRGALEMVGLHQNGNRFTLELTVNEVRFETRRIFVGAMRDITERKATAEKLVFLAQYDILTGLPNRALFMDRLSGAILRASRSRTALAVMFLDLDGFKAVNDTLGHHSGDELLRKFGERLTMAVRKTDSVARLAGDEFTVILEGMSQPENDTREVAEKIINAMQQHFELGPHQVRVTTSIGLAIHQGEETDLNELLRRADDAMYRAKQQGKNCWCH
jgi:diguanylate cyclase (GGDEF)-like protein/PAS domain S-box-containing protein